MNNLDPLGGYTSSSGFVYSENILKPEYKKTKHGFSDSNNKSKNKSDFKHSDYYKLSYHEFRTKILNKSIELNYEIY